MSSTAESLESNDRFDLLLAQPDHNATLCDVFQSVHVRGALDITQEREPDFFSLLRYHQGETATAVAISRDGETVGCGSAAMWPAFLGDEEIPAGYLCDLRVRPGFRGGYGLAQSYNTFMRHLAERHGTEIFTTVIFDANVQARQALMGGGRTEKRRDQPLYRPMTPFEMVSIQFTFPKAAPSAAVRRANESDRDELFSFLADQQRRRLLGRRLTVDLLLKRLKLWPDFGLESFFIWRSPSTGRIQGSVAPWNTRAFKRTRVLGYHGAMAFQRRAFDVAARLCGFRKLPRPGTCFDFSFLTHFEVRDDDPGVARDLLLAAYDTLRARKEHFMSAFVPKKIGYRAAFKGFMTTRTPMTLYAVHPQQSRYTSMALETAHPGFEMALS